MVCLVPARTDTAWWHDYAAKGAVRFIRGRLKFGGHKNSAPFPSALVIFSPQNAADHARPLETVACGRLFEEPAGKPSGNSKLQKRAE